MHAKQSFAPTPTPAWGQSLAVFLVVASTLFTLLPPGLNWDINYAEQSLREGSLAMKLEWGSLFLIASIICLIHRQRAWVILIEMNPYLRLIVLYCILSTFWSPVPIVTLKRASQILGTILLGMAFQVTRFSIQQFLRTILNTFIAIELISVVVVFVNPAMGADHAMPGIGAGGAWRGILLHKNMFGMLCAIAIFTQVVLATLPDSKPKPLMVFLSLLLSFICLIMSNSTTSLLVMFMGTCAYFSFKHSLIHARFIASRFFLATFILILLSLQIFYTSNAAFPTWDQLIGVTANSLGKESDLTGRLTIWDLMFPEIAKHWMFGFGYGGFWLGAGGPSQYLIDQLGWIVYQAHNGYLDILNEQGVIGFALFFAFLGRHIRDLRQLPAEASSEGAFFSALLLIILVANFSESSLFRGMNLLNVFLIYSSISTSSVLALARQKIVRGARKA